MSSNKSFSSETAERYARALFELTQEEKELGQTEENILNLLDIYNKNSDFENFVKNPTQTFSIQLDVIKHISSLLKFSKALIFTSSCHRILPVTI